MVRLGRRVRGWERLAGFRNARFAGDGPAPLGGIGGEGIARGAGYGGLDIFDQEGVAGSLPELGFDSARAAEAPFVMDESVDEEALLGIGGTVQLMILGGELGEIFGFFIEHDLVDGVDAVLEGVESGNGFSSGGAGSGRFLCVGAVSRGLFRGCHKSVSFD